MSNSTIINTSVNAKNNVVTVIRPSTGWVKINFREIWAFRELLAVLIIRDIKVRYKQTVMGVMWAVFQPISSMIIFSIIFGRLAQFPSEGYPYPVFVFSGMLAWTLFATSISSAGMSLVGSAHLISKVYFPRIFIPLASIGVSLVDFAISCVILIFLMLIYGQAFSFQILLLPVLLFGMLLVSLGTGCWLAAVTVSYRDFRYVISYIVQVWMYLTPVIYPITFIPEKWRWLMYLNPMYGWIDGIRACFLGKDIDQTGLLVSITFSITIAIIGFAYFSRTERRFADVI